MTLTAGAGGGGWRRDLVIALVAGTALFLVTLVPYLLAGWEAPRGQEFNGFFFIADDAATYISKMREGADGAWGWADPYISRPVAQPVMLFLFYILWGKVAGLLHISMYAGYHLARWSGAIALVAAARSLARAVLPPGRPRVVAVWIALIGAGAGYLLALLRGAVVLGEHLEALDLHLPELSGFYSVVAIPHFAWAAALMAWAVVVMIRLGRSDGARAAWLAAGALWALMLVLGFIHPQMLFVLAALAAVYAVMLRPSLRVLVAGVTAFAACAPAVLYFLEVLRGDPVVEAWSSQWRHQAPGPVSMLFGLGLPLLLGAIAVIRGPGRASPELRLMIAWVVVVYALLYIPNPVNIQRRLVDGVYLPVAALAALGVEEVARRRGGAPAPQRVFALVLACSVSSFLVLGVALTWAVSHDPLIYVPQAEIGGIDWLAGQRPPGTPPAVLSHPQTGLFIPPRSGMRVFVGHYSETIDYLARSRSAFDALRGGRDSIIALMRREDAEYLFYGPLEQALGPPRDVIEGGPGPRLVPVYDRGGVVIYRLES